MRYVTDIILFGLINFLLLTGCSIPKDEICRPPSSSDVLLKKYHRIEEIKEREDRIKNLQALEWAKKK